MKNLMDKLNNLPKGVQLVLAIIIFAVMFTIMYHVGFNLFAPSK